MSNLSDFLGWFVWVTPVFSPKRRNRLWDPKDNARSSWKAPVWIISPVHRSTAVLTCENIKCSSGWWLKKNIWKMMEWKSVGIIKFHGSKAPTSHDGFCGFWISVIWIPAYAILGVSFFPMGDFTTKYLIPIPRQGSMDWFKGKSTGNIRKP